jgi:3-hydroxybutyryl-CoA dehydrogenase
MADELQSRGQALPIGRAVVVIGAGTMGSGIAEVAALAGHTVYLRDTSAAALDRGIGQIRKSLDRRVERGRLDAAKRDAVMERLKPVDAQATLSDVGLVIEVIVERLDVKVEVLRQIESEVGADTIIASNTSSLSITAIAGRMARPQQVVGMHFFNPATVLPLVEVVQGAATDPAVVQTIVDTSRAWGKSPVVCRSTPGFIVNRIARPYYGEALRVLHEQGTAPATLDAVMRESGGFKMGPCELMDLIGHDVNFAVTRSVCAGFFDEPRYKPSLVQQELVDAGWLGRKSGRGFFQYGEGAATVAPDDADAIGAPPASVRIEGSLGPAAGLVRLLTEHAEITVEQVGGVGLLRVGGHALALSDGRTATQRALEIGEPLVLFDLALDYGSCARIALAASTQATAAHLDAAIGLFQALGKKVSVIGDLPGLAVTRTVAMLVNEAADAVLQGIASADDVDQAMRQGVNYPLGPMAWGRQVGLDHVLTVLRNLAQAYGEDRYRASLWLQRAVQAMQPLERSHG